MRNFIVSDLLVPTKSQFGIRFSVLQIQHFVSLNVIMKGQMYVMVSLVMERVLAQLCQLSLYELL